MKRTCNNCRRWDRREKRHDGRRICFARTQLTWDGDLVHVPTYTAPEDYECCELYQRPSNQLSEAYRTLGKPLNVSKT